MMLASSFALSAFNAPAMGVAPTLGAQRIEAPAMFGGGKKAAPKKAGAPAGRRISKSAANSKSAVSATGRSSSFVDVTGRPYVEVDTFVPKYDEIGVMPPLGRWDPLQIREQGPERYRRFVEMEIKHGRMSMAAVTGVLVTYSGIRWPGYLSTAEGIKFSDIPGGAISSWAALPIAAWFQIVLFISFLEIYFLKQDPEKDAGDVVPDDWVWARYPDGYDVWLGDGSTKQARPPPTCLPAPFSAPRSGHASTLPSPLCLTPPVLCPCCAGPLVRPAPRRVCPVHRQRLPLSRSFPVASPYSRMLACLLYERVPARWARRSSSWARPGS
jgi:hypothetical protein